MYTNRSEQKVDSNRYAGESKIKEEQGLGISLYEN